MRSPSCAPPAGPPATAAAGADGDVRLPSERACLPLPPGRRGLGPPRGGSARRVAVAVILPRGARDGNALGLGPGAYVAPLQRGGDHGREAVRRAGEDGRAEGGDVRGELVVVARRALVGEGEQDDEAHAGVEEAGGAAEHEVRVAALVEVGEEDEDGPAR